MNLPFALSKPKEKENLTAFYYENSPCPHSKKKELEGSRGFLSEQKENNIKKIVNNLNEKKASTQKLYYPLSSPNANNVRLFNSPNKFPIKDDNRNVSPHNKINNSGQKNYLATNGSNQKNQNIEQKTQDNKNTTIQ